MLMLIRIAVSLDDETHERARARGDDTHNRRREKPTRPRRDRTDETTTAVSQHAHTAAVTPESTLTEGSLSGSHAI
jgi:hypothetical protein